MRNDQPTMSHAMMYVTRKYQRPLQEQYSGQLEYDCIEQVRRERDEGLLELTSAYDDEQNDT